jgi:hypothetical protein
VDRKRKHKGRGKNHPFKFVLDKAKEGVVKSTIKEGISVKTFAKSKSISFLEKKSEMQKKNVLLPT